MQVTQCDMCRTLGPAPPEGWYVLARVEPVPVSFLSSILPGGSSPGADMAGTFCSLRCTAGYAAVKALADSVRDGEQP